MGSKAFKQVFDPCFWVHASTWNYTELHICRGLLVKPESSASANSATRAFVDNQLVAAGRAKPAYSLYPAQFSRKRNIEYSGGQRPHAALTRSRSSPVQSRSVALVPKGAAPAAVRQQRPLVCPNQRKGQEHSRTSSISRGFTIKSSAREMARRASNVV